MKVNVRNIDIRYLDHIMEQIPYDETTRDIVQGVISQTRTQSRRAQIAVFRCFIDTDGEGAAAGDRGEYVPVMIEISVPYGNDLQSAANKVKSVLVSMAESLVDAEMDFGALSETPSLPIAKPPEEPAK